MLSLIPLESRSGLRESVADIFRGEIMQNGAENPVRRKIARHRRSRFIDGGRLLRLPKHHRKINTTRSSPVNKISHALYKIYSRPLSVPDVYIFRGLYIQPRERENKRRKRFPSRLRQRLVTDKTSVAERVELAQPLN